MNMQEALAAVRNTVRFKRYSLKTERSYLGWCARYFAYCQRHPAGTSEEKIKGFLTELAERRNVAEAELAAAMARFTHDREKPLHECLLQAAIAAEEKTRPKNGRVRPLLDPLYDEDFFRFTEWLNAQ
ncbi:MAG: phage integrase N-terminal SAM-like domain-containing protein [Limnochordia bacterium]|nr:phage integrase N-terminal SAM-like domain-containing protein [Limnochordia bacterium]